METDAAQYKKSHEDAAAKFGARIRVPVARPGLWKKKQERGHVSYVHAYRDYCKALDRSAQKKWADLNQTAKYADYAERFQWDREFRDDMESMGGTVQRPPLKLSLFARFRSPQDAHAAALATREEWLRDPSLAPRFESITAEEGQGRTDLPVAATIGWRGAVRRGEWSSTGTSWPSSSTPAAAGTWGAATREGQRSWSQRQQATSQPYGQETSWASPAWGANWWEASEPADPGASSSAEQPGAVSRRLGW